MDLLHLFRVADIHKTLYLVGFNTCFGHKENSGSLIAHLKFMVLIQWSLFSFVSQIYELQKE